MTTGEKISAKSVKTRMMGFDCLHTIIANRDKLQFDQLGDKLVFAKLLKETNPGCFEKIINCYKEAVFAGWTTSTEEETRLVVENAFSSSKPAVKKLASDLIELNF